ncbi:hypothetical protein CSP5_1264 [Cuniculiplasma divulgatum]|jgi:hypothetical protein|uniref:Uncharacterized protein n=1 Tax=Cuniculiplasma divulgatum TaxID=1673428 RepID=A0A1N5V766_9ARCH|nr:MAG: hypothetical protein AMDU5_GPLC00003G0205 [Thermoplasmatales archaeon Gpl]SIM68931.1 hypothetical protein CSP5_1264 [Cuniculiplasma divulgatum]
MSENEEVRIVMKLRLEEINKLKKTAKNNDISWEK